MERVEEYHPQFNRFYEKPKIEDVCPRKSSVIYKLLGVSSEFSDNLRVLDECPNDNLVLIHYLHPTPECRNIRGIIIDTEREVVAGKSFPHTEEYLSSSEEVKKIPLDETCEVTKAYEGTILRVFCGKNTGTWYISTHRKINGRRSRWAGPTFGEMFDELWGDAKLEDFLSKENCYVFLLSHGANRLVCQIDRPCLYHVQTLTSGQNGLVPSKDTLLKSHPNVKEKTILQVKTIEELLKCASNLGWKECSGLLVTKYTSGIIEGCWKVVPEVYQQKRYIRGNEPNFRFRYIQLKKAGLQGTLAIRELFPEKKEVFDTVDKQLLELPEFIAALYEERFIYKRFVYLPAKIHYILNTTRDSYDDQKTLVENLNRELKKCNAQELNAMVRFMIQEKS